MKVMNQIQTPSNAGYKRIRKAMTVTQNQEITCGVSTSNVVMATTEWQWTAFENCNTIY